jgi:hypothetical protein
VLAFSSSISSALVKVKVIDIYQCDYDCVRQLAPLVFLLCCSSSDEGTVTGVCLILSHAHRYMETKKNRLNNTLYNTH